MTQSLLEADSPDLVGSVTMVQFPKPAELPGTSQANIAYHPEKPETPEIHPWCRMYSTHIPGWATSELKTAQISVTTAQRSPPRPCCLLAQLALHSNSTKYATAIPPQIH